MKNKIIPLILSAATIFSVCSCQNAYEITTNVEQTEISFSWWGNDARNEYTIKAIQEFERLNPDIRVKCVYSEWSGFQIRSNALMASNTEADVMQINYAWIEQYSPDGTGYYDISTLSHIVNLNQFTENELNYGMKNGRLNALPIALNTETIYINKTLCDEYGLSVPQTWEDLFHAAEVMNGEHYPLTANNKATLFTLVAYAEQKSGNEFIKADGTLGFTAEDFETMLEFYCELVDKKVMPQTEYFERIKLDSGEYAGTIAWLSDASSYMGGAEKAGNEIVIADYLKNDNAVGMGWYTKPATMYAISDNTEYPEEAARLLDFLLNSKEMAELQSVEKGIPISKAARAYLESNGKLTGLQYDAFLKMNEFSDKMKVISPFMENSNILDNVQQSCNSVYYGKTTSEEEAAILMENVKKVLKEAQS